MNIDERLDRLELVVERIAEKHEGLSHSVELLVAMHKDHERNFEEHQKQFHEHQKQYQERKRLISGVIESIAETKRQLAENDRTLIQLLARARDEQQQDRKQFDDVMMRLSVIAEAHQDTLDDHERRLGDRKP